MKRKLLILFVVLMAIASMLYITKNKNVSADGLTKSDVEALLNKYRGSDIYMPCDTCAEPTYEVSVAIPNIMELRVILYRIIGASKVDFGETGWEEAMPMIKINYDGEYDLNIIIISENMVAINHDREVYTIYKLIDNANIKSALTNLYNSYKK